MDSISLGKLGHLFPAKTKTETTSPLLTGCKLRQPLNKDTVSFQGSTQALDETLPFRFHQVDENLYRGALPLEENIKTLLKKGVRTFIDFRSAIETKYNSYSGPVLDDIAKSLGIKPEEVKYINIPINLMGGESAILETLPEKLSEAYKIVGDRKSPVYFHCAQGVERTGVFAVLYRVKKQGWDMAKAVAEMAHVNDGNKTELMEVLLKGLKRLI